MASIEGKKPSISWTELREDHLKGLTEAGINVTQAMTTGQLEVLPWAEDYLRGDRFDQKAMLALLEEILQSSAAAGYPLTRCLAHMEWVLQDKPGVDDLVEYEIRVNQLFSNYEDPVI